MSNFAEAREKCLSLAALAKRNTELCSDTRNALISISFDDEAVKRSALRCIEFIEDDEALSAAAWSRWMSASAILTCLDADLITLAEADALMDAVPKPEPVGDECQCYMNVAALMEQLGLHL